MEELQLVIRFDIQRYKDILNDCKNDKDTVRPAEISFAKKFIATYLFIKVKGTRPMTYQYLASDMIKQAKKNGGYIDQKVFKTASNDRFDSFVIDKTSRHMIDDFVKFGRPLSSLKCNYLLINRNGLQHNKLTHMMSQLVFEAIGKYINRTRYRQIIETESVQNLSPDEQKWVTEDQKHSSNVARTHYQKKRSRDLAQKGQCCMSKLRGKAGEVLDKSLEEISESSKIYSSDGDESDQDNEQTYSEKMDVTYSNTTDTVLSNKGSSTSRSLIITIITKNNLNSTPENRLSIHSISISNTKSKAVLFSKKEDQNLFARPQEA